MKQGITFPGLFLLLIFQFIIKLQVYHYSKDNFKTFLSSSTINQIRKHISKDNEYKSVTFVFILAIESWIVFSVESLRQICPISDFTSFVLFKLGIYLKNKKPKFSV